MQARRQVAALPVRQTNGVTEVLLVTSRDTGRWVIPKGWTSKRLTDFEAAAREAMQEAGVDGRITTEAIGKYSYIKREIGQDAPVEVTVYLLAVKNQWTRWREKNQRQRVWFPAAEAAGKVSEPELSDLISAVGRTSIGGPLAGQGWVDARAAPEAQGKGNGKGGQDGDAEKDAFQAGPVSEDAE
jgi:8-oxo-dGTP pyrophosphatase MutT (NUDIX family)